MLDFDPESPEFQEDPYPTYLELRDHHPVFRHPTRGFWAISRYDDVVDVLRRPEAFSSRRILDGEPGADPSSFLPMIVILDPPRHDELRALMSRAFTPRRIAELEPRIRAIASELIDAFVEKGACDLFSEFSAPLPTTVIAELLGVPPGDRALFKEKSTEVASSVRPGAPPPVLAAASELAAYLAEAFEEKRKRPRDDLMSALLEAEIDGKRLNPQELLGFAFLLLLAGNETTTNLISNAAVLLDRYRDERERLTCDPSLIPSAVEEFLRFDPPVQGLERIVTEDLVVRGQPLRRGEKVFVLLASANRDERHFSGPDRFDAWRDPNRHLSFGLGTHFCLGASLARLEARVAWEEILARLPDFRVSGPTERLPSSIFRGLLRLPVEFRPGPRSRARA